MILLILEIVAGVICYYLLKRELTQKYDVKFVERAKWMLVSPILQVLLFIPICYTSLKAMDIAMNAGKLQHLSTWTPLFGDDVNSLVDLGISSGLLDDKLFESPYYSDLVTSAAFTQLTSYIGLVVFLIMIFIQVRGIFGCVKEKRMKVANTVNTITIIVVTSMLAWTFIKLNKFINSGDGNNVFLLIITFIIIGLFMLFTNKFITATSLFYREKDSNRKIQLYESSQPVHNGTISKVEQLQELKKLLDQGFLTQEEFDNEKRKILNQ